MLYLIEKRFNELFEEVPKSQQVEKDDSFDFGYQKIQELSAKEMVRNEKQVYEVRKSCTTVELAEEMKIRQATFLILSKFDTDRTGSLDLEQFREFYGVINASIKVVDSLFELIDQDKDDQIDNNELFEFLKLIVIKDIEIE